MTLTTPAFGDLGDLGAPTAERVSLPLPPVTWGVEAALTAVGYVQAEFGVTLPGDLEVVSVLTTVVLRAGDVAVKVYPAGTDAASLSAAYGALDGSRTALLPFAGPYDTPSGVVTLSSWLHPAARLDWGAAGRLLRRFHDEHAGARLPAWTPMSRLVGQVADLDPFSAGVLLAARDRLLSELGGVGSVLGYGTIHGDFSPSNVVTTATGPVLIDLDWAAHGPLEYDLASVARRAATGEVSQRKYRAFCSGYGFDVRGWPGLDLLDRVAHLGGVAFRLWDDRHHGRSLDWLPAAVQQLAGAE